MDDLISRQAAIETVQNRHMMLTKEKTMLINDLKKLPPAQPAQLEQCPIYGGMCCYPSDQCYDCPRHAGAKMESEVTE